MGFVLGYCLLCVVVHARFPEYRVRNRFVVGTAFALLLWHIPGVITLVASPKEVLCANEITLASNRSSLCAISGNLTALLCVDGT
jgi:hypothetical protein